MVRRICDIESDALINGLRISFAWLFVYSIVFLFDSDLAKVIYPETLRVVESGFLVLYFPYVILFHRQREAYIRENFLIKGMNLFLVGWMKLIIIAMFYGVVSLLKNIAKEDVFDSLLLAGKDFLTQISTRLSLINTELVLIIFVFSFSFFFFTYSSPNLRDNIKKIEKRIEEKKIQKKEIQKIKTQKRSKSSTF